MIMLFKLTKYWSLYFQSNSHSLDLSSFFSNPEISNSHILLCFFKFIESKLLFNLVPLISISQANFLSSDCFTSASLNKLSTSVLNQISLYSAIMIFSDEVINSILSQLFPKVKNFNSSSFKTKYLVKLPSFVLIALQLRLPQYFTQISIDELFEEDALNSLDLLLNSCLFNFFNESFDISPKLILLDNLLSGFEFSNVLDNTPRLLPHILFTVLSSSFHNSSLNLQILEKFQHFTPADNYFNRLFHCLPNSSYPPDYLEKLLSLIDRSLIPPNFKYLGLFSQIVVLLVNAHWFQSNCSIKPSFTLLKRAFDLLLLHDNSFSYNHGSSFELCYINSNLFNFFYPVLSNICLYSLSSISIGRGVFTEFLYWKKLLVERKIHTHLIEFVSQYIEIHGDKSDTSDVYDLSLQLFKENSKFVQYFSQMFPCLFYPFACVLDNVGDVVLFKHIKEINMFLSQLLYDNYTNLEQLVFLLFSVNDVCLPLATATGLTNAEAYALVAAESFKRGVCGPNVSLFLYSRVFSPSFYHLYCSSTVKLNNSNNSDSLMDDLDLSELSLESHFTFDVTTTLYPRLQFQNISKELLQSHANEFVSITRKSIISDSFLVSMARLPQTRGLCISVLTEEDLPFFVVIDVDFALVMDNFQNILDDSLTLLKNFKYNKNTKTDSDKSSWWTSRYRQNDDLNSLFTSTDDKLNIISDLLNGEFRYRLDEKFLYLFDGKNLPLLHSIRGHDSNYTYFIESLLVLALNSSDSSKCVLNYLNSVLNSNILIPKRLKELTSKLSSSLFKSAPKTPKGRPRSISSPSLSPLCLSNFTVCLILDNSLRDFPFESLNGCRNQPFARFFNYLHFLKSFESLTKTNKGLSVCDPNSLYYCINPGGDLPSTTESFNDFYSKFSNINWRGLIDKQNSLNSVEIFNAICNHNLFFYCGHGSGESLFDSKITPSKSNSAPLAAFFNGMFIFKIKKLQIFRFRRFFPSLFTNVRMWMSFTRRLLMGRN
ncbi:hypothetical protein GEMRC1_007629 [Eukaryota sp. GEM-RC1]